MKIRIKDGLYDEEIIAFVRKLSKSLRFKPKDGETNAPDESRPLPRDWAYVVQLKVGYKLDSEGRVNSIFLNREEGEAVMRQIEEYQNRQEKGTKRRGTDTSQDPS